MISQVCVSPGITNQNVMKYHSLPTEQSSANAAPLNPPAFAGRFSATKRVVQILLDLNSTAEALGAIAAELEVFYHLGKVVFYNHFGVVEEMTGLKFRTWVNHQGVFTYREFDTETGLVIPCSLGLEEAETILESMSFLKNVKPLVASNDEGGRL